MSEAPPEALLIILGVIILAIGAVLLLDHYRYLPSAFPLPKETIVFAAGIACTVSGIVLIIKKLFAKEGL